MDNPILNPSIPYFGQLGVDRFAPQKLIRINGVVSQATYRFDITLQCGPSSHFKNDLALQVRVFVRLLNESISVNSFRNGIWEEELCKSTVPIKLGETFEIILLCTFDHYKITINGEHCFDYPQKIHYDKISGLGIEGNVSITQISYESATGSSSNISSLPENGFKAHLYPTLPLHIVELNRASSWEEPNIPTEPIKLNCLPTLQLDSVANDGNVVNSDTQHVQNDRHCLKCIYVIFVLIIIIIIAFLMIKTGQYIKITMIA